jgi:hypothetical protein
MEKNRGVINEIVPDRSGAIVIQFHSAGVERNHVIAWIVTANKQPDEPELIEQYLEPEPIIVGADHLSDVYCLELAEHGQRPRWHFPYDATFDDLETALEYGRKSRRGVDEIERNRLMSAPNGPPS